MPLELFTVGEPIADTKAPTDVPVPQMWDERKFRARLVNPANRRRLATRSSHACAGFAVDSRRGSTRAAWPTISRHSRENSMTSYPSADKDSRSAAGVHASRRLNVADTPGLYLPLATTLHREPGQNPLCATASGPAAPPPVRWDIAAYFRSAIARSRTAVGTA